MPLQSLLMHFTNNFYNIVTEETFLCRKKFNSKLLIISEEFLATPKDFAFAITSDVTERKRLI